MDDGRSKAVRSHDRERGILRETAGRSRSGSESRRRKVAALGPFRIADRRASRLLHKVVDRLPQLDGRAVEVRFAPELSAHKGKLLSRGGKGRAVHAGSEIRKRLMVLDSDLLREPEELTRIFLHELHHFVWVRLGNPARRAYEEMAKTQFGARGELGWSAEMLKRNLTRADVDRRSRRWRDYVGESFCDTAAWYHMRKRQHDEWTLATSHRERRARWFSEYLPAVLSL